MRWRSFDTWQAALAAGLAFFGLQNKDKTRPINEADIKTLPLNGLAAPENSILHHPADRQSMVFKDEPAVSLIARNAGFSLILFCPFVEHNGVGYNHLWGTMNRPPIYARWSTGRQGQHKPLVLGCLPRQTTTKNKGFEVFWFFMEPDKKNPPEWLRQIHGRNIDVMGMGLKIGFPMKDFKAPVFLWALVSLHRRRVVGDPITDDHLACWIWQFGHHLLVNCKPSTHPLPVPFTYDKARLPEHNKKFPNAQFTFDRLTQWILSPSMRIDGVWIGDYARLWDRAIDAQIQYQLAKTDDTWKKFADAMGAARKLPF